MSWESRVFPLQHQDFLHLKSDFPHLKSNFPCTKSDSPKSAFYFLQRLSAFFNSFLTFFNGFPNFSNGFPNFSNGFLIFLNGFPLSKKSEKIYQWQEVYKRLLFKLRIFATHSPSFVITAKQYLSLTQHNHLPHQLPLSHPKPPPIANPAWDVPTATRSIATTRSAGNSMPTRLPGRKTGSPPRALDGVWRMSPLSSGGWVRLKSRKKTKGFPYLVATGPISPPTIEPPDPIKRVLLHDQAQFILESPDGPRPISKVSQ